MNLRIETVLGSGLQACSMQVWRSVIGVEAACKDVHVAKHAAVLTKGLPGNLHGSFSCLLQNKRAKSRPPLHQRQVRGFGDSK